MPPFFLVIDSIKWINDTLLIPDGAIFTSSYGGVLPHSYLWSTGSTTSDITGLDSGMYILTVTDQLGCQLTLSQVVSSFPVGIVGRETINHLRVYPNPAGPNTLLHVRSDLALKGLRLLTLQGHTATTLPIRSDGNYHLPNLPSGTYILEADYTNGGKDYKHVLIIQ